tara:strand:+ start:2090 stop:2335 length:246 start_codon:yes stop_codon:yes gene_type:complete
MSFLAEVNRIVEQLYNKTNDPTTLKFNDKEVQVYSVYPENFKLRRSCERSDKTKKCEWEGGKLKVDEYTCKECQKKSEDDE